MKSNNVLLLVLGMNVETPRSMSHCGRSCRTISYALVKTKPLALISSIVMAPLLFEELVDSTDLQEDANSVKHTSKPNPHK